MKRGGSGETATAGAIARGTSADLWREAASWPLAERLHLAGRFQSAPWERILARLPREGSLLDVGCGPGLLAWLLAREGFAGTYLGLDPDGRKVERARRWPLPAGRFSFEKGRAQEAPRGAFTAAAVVDVLYLVPPRERAGFAAGVVSALCPGGLLVVVTSGGGPPWKRALDRAQERTAVAIGMTRGEAVAPCDGAEAARVLEGAGVCDVRVETIGNGYSHGFEVASGIAGAVPRR